MRAENVVRFDLVTESLNVGRDGGASTVPADGAVCAALAAWMLASYAGPCLDEIGRMEAKINAKLDAKAAAGPPAPASAMAGMSAALDGYCRGEVGEISPQTVHAVEQAMASARAADGAGDKAACEQALADMQRALGQ